MLSKKKMIFSWSLVILCVLSIFLIVPIARTISKFVEEKWNISVFVYSVLIVIFIAFLYSLYFLWHRLKIRSPFNYFWLAAVASVYVFSTLKLWGRPVEAIHFMEYGLLGILLFNAFRHHIHDKSIYFAAFLSGSIIGILDEIFQWVIPDRFWDMRDIGLNALSVALCQIAIWKGLNPEISKTGISPKSLRIISWLLATNLLLLGICSSNTPNRVRSYTKSLPFLSFLNDQEPMNEHTHRHRDPEIGVFFSRLSLIELAEIDNQKAEEYGAYLKEWSKKKYGDFLLYHPGYARPFLHEFRVHVFRRNRRSFQAKKTNNQKEREENLLIAYKENLILEKYFGATLEKSPYKWRTSRKKQIEKEIDITPFYRSPVSAVVHIPLDEKLLWGAILLIIIVLVFLNMRISQKQKSA